MNSLVFRTRQAAVGRAVRAGAPVIRRWRKEATQFHFDAESYVAEVSRGVPGYREMQAAIATATLDMDVRLLLDLGIGTGETTAAVLAAHPAARVTGVDASSRMLEVARRRLEAVSIDALVLSKLENFQPRTPFDLVVSSLAVHHLGSRHKRSLFARIYDALLPGGRFVLADVVRPERRQDAATPISRVYDRPERAGDLERWLSECGFDAHCQWAVRDLVVISADRGDLPRRARGSATIAVGTGPEGDRTDVAR